MLSASEGHSITYVPELSDLGRSVGGQTPRSLNFKLLNADSEPLPY